MTELIEMHAIFEGRVQGVGFRATTQKTARDLNLKGTVRNKGNERVEIVAQGKKEDLNQLIETLKNTFNHESLQDVKLEFREPKETFDTFSVIA